MTIEDFIIATYCVVDSYFKQVYPSKGLRQRGEMPSLTDQEVITMEIVGEYLSLGCDKRIWNYFRTHWLGWFPKLGCRTSFTRQGANLLMIKQLIQQAISSDLCQDQDLYLFDGFPIPVCHIKRYKYSSLFKGQGAVGYCAAKDVHIAGQPYPHLLFHFMLPYSCWGTFSICHSESFDSLASGFEKAVWELGGVLPEHRTDNLSAATKKCGSSREFTDKWQELLSHYNVKPSRNNPGVSHENGSVEKSHDTLKQAVKQHLLLRGSCNFADLKAYEAFLHQIKEKRNSSRQQRLVEELPKLKELPNRKWNAPTVLPVRVNPMSQTVFL